MNDELSAMHDRALQAEQALIEARNYHKDEVARLEDEIATLKACKMGVDDTIKEVLRQAIMVVAYRAGDISTEDGSYATTCTDSIIHLESALCEALGTKHDDIDLSEALELLGKMRVISWEVEAKRAYWNAFELGASMGSVSIEPRWDEYIAKRKGELLAQVSGAVSHPEPRTLSAFDSHEAICGCHRDDCEYRV